MAERIELLVSFAGVFPMLPPWAILCPRPSISSSVVSQNSSSQTKASPFAPMNRGCPDVDAYNIVHARGKNGKTPPDVFLRCLPKTRNQRRTR